MMYPFMTLSDGTEIVHSEKRADNRVKVYLEKAVYGGFHNATCYLPDYTWEDVIGFSEADMQYYKTFVENNAHLIIEFSQKGGFSNASNF